ncbi:MAG: hypothetical protein V4539_23875 [Bacteroidota bacterium]
MVYKQQKQADRRPGIIKKFAVDMLKKFRSGSFDRSFALGVPGKIQFDKSPVKSGCRRRWNGIKHLVC